MPGKGADGFWATAGLGVGGALIAVAIGKFAGFWHPGDAPGFVLSVVGAIMLLALYRVLRSKSASHACFKKRESTAEISNK
jgi:uncharacterized membrane protein YeaQ/YmgE (transglycosylase-associated protein family)